MESVDAFTVQTYVVTSTHIKAETLTVKLDCSNLYLYKGGSRHALFSGRRAVTHRITSGVDRPTSRTCMFSKTMFVFWL